MDTLYPQIVGLLAIALLLTLYQYGKLRAYAARQRQLRINEESKRLAALDRLSSAVVERAGLNDAEFPPLNPGLYSQVCDLYDEPELMPYAMPVVARDRYEIYWDRVDLDDQELITLWLAGIIQCPKT